MKTNELIDKLTERDFQVQITDFNPYEIEILYNGVIRARVNRDFVCSLSIENTYEEMSDVQKIFLFNVLYKYVSTPIDDRDDEKKYRLKHKWLLGKDSKYLCYDKLSYRYFLSEEPLISDEITSEFTQEHINSISRKFDTNLEDFTIVEVTQ